MTKNITWVGIDDSKKELAVAVVRGGKSQEVEESKVPNEDRALKRWVRRLERESDGGPIRMCYEAGPNGYSLKRRLESFGRVEVEVMAPSLTPRRLGHRVKTDRLDARRLVFLYRAGELSPIAVPGEDDESARDLVRLLHGVVTETTRKRHQIQKFLVRRGRIWREGSNWTGKYRQWLGGQTWERWADAETFLELRTGLEELEARQRRMETALERLAAEDQRALAVSVLRCFHGIDTRAALTMVTEIFDVRRFGHPRDLMGYWGMTPTVSQTGESEHRGGISKAGTRYGRWVLGQVAWNYRHAPRVGAGLRRRRAGQPAWAIAIADRAHQRLYRRYEALLRKGKSPHKAVTAVGRELLAFVWEALMEASTSRETSRREAA